MRQFILAFAVLMMASTSAQAHLVWLALITQKDVAGASSRSDCGWKPRPRESAATVQADFGEDATLVDPKFLNRMSKMPLLRVNGKKKPYTTVAVYVPARSKTIAFTNLATLNQPVTSGTNNGHSHWVIWHMWILGFEFNT